MAGVLGWLLLGGRVGAEDILVPVGAAWRYFKGTSEASSPVTAWRQVGFDDGSWLSGPTGIGYGDGDDATVLADMQNNYISVFMRKTFTVADPSAVTVLELSMSYDDGFVAYLNGVEIARRGLSGNPVPFNAAATSHEAGVPEVISVLPSLLLAGSNVLAIQAHNAALSSSDLSAIPELTANPDVGLSRGPYLQLGGPAAQTVVWQTDAAATGVVEYGLTPGLGSSTAHGPPSSTTHAVQITGLEPDTEYHYRVLSNGIVLASGLTFRTYPAPGSSAPFRCAAWGDSGWGDQNQLNVAARLAALEPDLGIHTGDVIYPNGEAANYSPRYFQPYASLLRRVNVLPSLGNHDVATLSGQPYLDAFYLPANNPAVTERYYSFDHGDVHFIALDTNQAMNTGSAMRSWLESDLATMGGAWTVVFHHHTPYTTSTSHADDPLNATMRAYLTPLYDTYGVDLVLTGHTHAYERTYPVKSSTAVSAAQDPSYTDPLGTIYLTTGGGGAPLSARNPTHPNNAFLAVYQQQFHAVTLDFDGGALTGRAVKHDGVVLDAFTITKTPDATPPVISGLAAVEVSDSAARIIWSTDELSDSRIEHGLTAAFGSEQSPVTRVTSHSIQLAGLSPGREHFYRVLSGDRAGNEAASATGTFFTSGLAVGPDTAAYWRFEDNLFDAAPGGRHGTGSIAYSTSVPAAAVPQTGVPDARSLFLGGTSSVSCPDPALDLVDSGSATIECFFAAGSPLADRILLHQGSSAADGFGPEAEMHLHVTAQGAVGFQQFQGGAANVALSTADGIVVPDGWHHAAVTLDGTRARLWVDGVLASTDGSYASIDKTGWAGELRVGRTVGTAGASRAWFGYVDELRVSSRPLSPGELLRAQPTFRLDVIPPGVVARSDALQVQVFGSSTLSLFGFSAKLRYDPRLVEFTGSQAVAFAGTVWSDAESQGLVVDPAAGAITLGVVRDAGSGSKPPLAPQDTAPFAVLDFVATGCTGAATFDLDESSADNNILVVEAPGVVGEEPLLFDAATVIQAGETFVRGDVNGQDPIDPDDPTAAITLSDPLYLLDNLFRQGPDPPCREAADVNADARINIVDAVYLLQHLFGSPAAATIPAPWPQAGRAPVQYFTCYNAPTSTCVP